jgi:hypothetical protein
MFFYLLPYLSVVIAWCTKRIRNIKTAVDMEATYECTLNGCQAILTQKRNVLQSVRVRCQLWILRTSETIHFQSRISFELLSENMTYNNSILYYF